MSEDCQRAKSLAPNILLSFALSILMISVLQGGVRFWGADGFFIWGAIRYALCYSAVIGACALLWARISQVKLGLSLEGFALGLSFYLLTDSVTSRFSFFPGVTGRADLVVLILLCLFLCARRVAVISILALLAPLLLTYALLSASGGRLVFSDDHAAVLYRLMLLGKHFPTLSFYNTLWNAGVESRDFLGTGTLNIFFLSRLITLFTPIEQGYNYVIILICFFLAPFSAYRAAVALNLSDRIAKISALLALAPSMAWWCWCFQYGAMGFVTSAVLLPWVFAEALVVSDKFRSVGALRAIFFAFLATLYLFWPLAGLVLLPVALINLPNLPILIRRPSFVVTMFIIIIINFSWAAVFWKISKVDSFVAMGSGGSETDDRNGASHWNAALMQKGVKVSFSGVLERLRSNATGANPILLFLGLPGVLFLSSARLRWSYGTTVLMLSLVGTVVAQLKPHFELERMLLLLLILLIVPCAVAVDRLIGTAKDSLYNLRLALVSAWLILGVLVSSSVAANRSIHRISFADGSVAALTTAISQNAVGGRVAFVGFVLHQFSGGHLAPLALLANKPLLTSAFTHSVWRYTELVPPIFNARGIPGAELYFDLMNVSVLAAHEKGWRINLGAHPELYQRLGQFGQFELFKRLNWQPSYFYEGEGEVISQETNQLQIKLKSDSAVLKFNYLPILQSSACTISARSVEQTLSFIELKGCPVGQVITINTVPIHSRLLNALGDSKKL